jgi:hypothetical protein
MTQAYIDDIEVKEPNNQQRQLRFPILSKIKRIKLKILI